MTEGDGRGAQFEPRRKALGISNLRQFALATGRDRDTLARAEAGTASKTTMDWVDAWLTAREADRAGATAPDEPLRLTLHGVYGIEEIIVEGPVDRPDELADAVGRILDRLKRSED